MLNYTVRRFDALQQVKPYSPGNEDGILAMSRVKIPAVENANGFVRVDRRQAAKEFDEANLVVDLEFRPGRHFRGLVRGKVCTSAEVAGKLECREIGRLGR
jgi:hypothetical protein